MPDGRLDHILEILMALARQEFTARAEVSERCDDIDAIATGINLLAEELDGAVASRRELEAACAALEQAQAQLVEAGKLAAIGQLASGVAHEINNPASWVLLGLSLARRRLDAARALPPGPELDAALASLDAALVDASQGMDRIRAVTRDLRVFSRHGNETREPVALEEVVRAACQLARPAYAAVAAIRIDAGGGHLVLGDRDRLGQVVTNLVINAAQAIGAGDPAVDHIAVSLSRVGDAVVLAVEDSGPGIPAELRERVFEPYYTTKPGDTGTGLGLALVRRIAHHHGGEVAAVAPSGRGARIEVRLPAHRPSAPIAAPSPAIVVPYGPRRRILVIDDEPLLLRTLAEALEERHDVATASGGREALDRLAREPDFDLVLCDLQMPELDGVAFHRALIARGGPAAERIVFMTGGAVTTSVRRFLEDVRPRLLEKPIHLDELEGLVAAAHATKPS